MEKLLQQFEERFSDYTFLERLSHVHEIKDDDIVKYDYTDAYVDDCSITANYLFDLIQDKIINNDAKMNDLLELLNTEFSSIFVILFEYYMINEEMHTLCFIIDPQGAYVCQSYGGITAANHQYIKRAQFTKIMENFHKNPNILIPIGDYKIEIDEIRIATAKNFNKIVLPKITPELEQILYDARECYIHHRFNYDKPQYDDKYRKITSNNDLYDFITNLHKKCAEQGYKISCAYCKPYTYMNKLKQIYEISEEEMNLLDYIPDKDEVDEEDSDDSDDW